MRASFGVVRRGDRGAPTGHSPAGEPVGVGGGPKLGPSRHLSVDSNACLASEVQSYLQWDSWGFWCHSPTGGPVGAGGPEVGPNQRTATLLPTVKSSLVVRASATRC